MVSSTRCANTLKVAGSLNPGGGSGARLSGATTTPGRAGTGSGAVPSGFGEVAQQTSRSSSGEEGRRSIQGSVVREESKPYPARKRFEPENVPLGAVCTS